MEDMKDLNNFEIDEKAKELSDCHSAYELARLYIDTNEELKKLRRENIDSQA